MEHSVAKTLVLAALAFKNPKASKVRHIPNAAIVQIPKLQILPKMKQISFARPTYDMFKVGAVSFS